MSRLSIGLTLLALTGLAPATLAQSAGNEFYIQIDGGVDYYPENELDGDSFDINPGFSASGRLGTEIIGLRGELEVGIALSTIDVGFDAGDDDADYYQFSGVAAAYKDIGPVYLGLGAGLVYQEIESEVLGVTISNDETNFIAHAEAGISFSLTESVKLVPHYRATWLPGFDLDDEVFVHSARLGLRWGL